MAAGLAEAVTFRDAKGNTARVSFFVDSGGTAITQHAAAAAVITAMEALSNAIVQAYKGPATNPSIAVVYGANATFASIEDKAIFTFLTADGSTHRYQIPAPLEAIFLADGETVDPSNTAVTAFTSAVVANTVGRTGTAITFGAFGTRIRRKMRRRINIFTKDPSLSGPDE